MTSRVIRLKAVALIDRGVAAIDGSANSGSATSGSTTSVDRRVFLKYSASSLALSWLSACNSSGPRSAEKVLAYATRKNEAVEQWLLRHTAIDHGSPGAVVAANRFPSYFISKTVPVLDETVAGRWALEVSGLVRNPLRLSLAQLMSMPRAEQRVNHFCVEGWNAVALFTGVTLREIAKLAGVNDEARVVDFQSFDDGYHESWDIDSTMHPQTMVVYAKDGAALTPAYGAPARLHSPIKLGYKNTKYLTKVVFMAERNGGYWSDRGYEWFGGT